mmetsp:Transcript_24617/g.82403  ORF Transcript_24617/g.82403 Transcript_24617/m.82403 type:complete len:251 (+) Transcript_24617:432-1184(+)
MPPWWRSNQRFAFSNTAEDSGSNSLRAIQPEQSSSNVRHIMANCFSVMAMLMEPEDEPWSFGSVAHQSSQFTRMSRFRSKNFSHTLNKLQCLSASSFFKTSKLSASGLQSKYSGGCHFSRKLMSSMVMMPPARLCKRSNNLFIVLVEPGKPHFWRLSTNSTLVTLLRPLSSTARINLSVESSNFSCTHSLKSANTAVALLSRSCKVICPLLSLSKYRHKVETLPRYPISSQARANCMAPTRMVSSGSISK